MIGVQTTPGGGRHNAHNVAHRSESLCTSGNFGWVIFDHKVAGTRDKVKEGEKKMFQHSGSASGGYYEKSNLKYKKSICLPATPR